MNPAFLLRNKINELIKSEGVAVILNNSGSYNVPRSTESCTTPAKKEPVAELNIPMEAFQRMERLIRHVI